MQPLRCSINVTLDGCCDHRAMLADEYRPRHASGDTDPVLDRFSRTPLPSLTDLYRRKPMSSPPLAEAGPVLARGMKFAVEPPQERLPCAKTVQVRVAEVLPLIAGATVVVVPSGRVTRREVRAGCSRAVVAGEGDRRSRGRSDPDRGQERCRQYEPEDSPLHGSLLSDVRKILRHDRSPARRAAREVGALNAQGPTC
jgi:hypothetical protein